MDAQVDLNPHQVEAALFAFRSPLSSGAILADEVGLGKTIEAGLVISQKWAERKRKILIIVPANLRKQWNQELLEKFYLPTFIMETKSFNSEIHKSILNPFQQNEIVICSYQFARKQEAYIRLVRWDLVVIDEAHRLRNVYKSNNRIANSIKLSVAHAPKILLTATPLQNSLLELYGLVSIIDDYAFGDLKSFKSQYSRINDETSYEDLKSRLKPICIRTLRRQVLEYIRYTNRIPITQEFYPTEEEQRLYDFVTTYLQSEKLYALPQGQRQLMTLILRRLLASSTYAIAGTLESLINRLDDIVEQQHPPHQSIEDQVSENFEIIDELADEWDGEEDEVQNKVYTASELEELKLETNKLREFFNLAKSIQLNSKGESLLTALKRGFSEAGKLGASRKALIFTESTRTQKYLLELLQRTEFKNKIVLFNGSNTDELSKRIYDLWLIKHKGTDKVTGSRTADIRSALIEYFRDEAEIMIATEAAAEGVNLQFCSLVVNYDLPWNPQRIEQRIGRCHRYGQKYDVVVVNFLNKANAADQRVYELLAEKFKLFEGVFGASDEVLGSIESGVDFEKRIAKIYQNCRSQEDINSAFDELQRSLNDEIDTTLKSTRQKLLENFDEEVTEKLKLNLSLSKEFLSKYEDWLWKLTKYYLADYAVFDNGGYSFYLRKNPFEKERIFPGPYRISKEASEENIYRIGHPLAQRIIENCKHLETNISSLTFDYSTTTSKISILESLVGTCGVLAIYQMTISAFDTEDYLIQVGITDDSIIIAEEQCKRMFSLTASIEETTTQVNEEMLLKIEENLMTQRNKIVDNVSNRNGKFFEDELEKLDKWGEDRRNSLKISLKDLDDEIKELKKQARLAPNLPEKLKIEKERKRLESKRDEAWREYDSAAKEIDILKDKLIDDIESKMQQDINIFRLFLIRWYIK
jgi:ERCC4-related helicase